MPDEPKRTYPCPDCGFVFFNVDAEADGHITVTAPQSNLLRRAEDDPDAVIAHCPNCRKPVKLALKFGTAELIGTAADSDPRKFRDVLLTDLSYRSAGPFENEAVATSAAAFVANADRARSIAEVSLIAVGLTFLEGQLDGVRVTEQSKFPASDGMYEVMAGYAKLYASPMSPVIRQASLASGSVRLAGWAERHSELGLGLDGILASQIVLTWTAFETLAGDLWERSINAFPMHLAKLNGKPTRIVGADNEDDGGELDEADDEASDRNNKRHAKKVLLGDLDRLTNGRYDLSKMMGTLLRTRYRFTSLAGIRRAYSAAFSEKVKTYRTDSIDKALGSKALDALSLVRNVIVHKAGVADEDYIRDSKGVPNAPQVKSGPVPITGETVRLIVESSISETVALLGAVDRWLAVTGR